MFGVSWDDPSFKKVRDARRRMGVLFQNGALFSALTVFDNVAFPLRERGRRLEKKIRAIVHAKLSSGAGAASWDIAAGKPIGRHG